MRPLCLLFSEPGAARRRPRVLGNGFGDTAERWAGQERGDGQMCTMCPSRESVEHIATDTPEKWDSAAGADD